MENELIYEPINMMQIKEFAAMWADEKVIRYTNIKEPLDGVQSVERFERLIKGQSQLMYPTLFAVIDGEEVCGMIGCLCVDEAKKIFGLFYQLSSKKWGQGIGLRSAKWLMEYMIGHYHTLTIIADVVAENVASKKILEHLQFSKNDVHHAAFNESGRMLDIVDYSWTNE